MFSSRPVIRTVAANFRALVRAAYPALDADPAYWRLTEYLLFGALYDARTGALRISQQQLALLEDRVDDLHNHRYVAQQFLDRYSAAITPIRYSGWSYTRHETRVVLHCTFHPEVLAALDNELAALPGADRVTFTTGEPFTRRLQRRIRRTAQAEGTAQIDHAACEPARALLSYLNGLPSHRFQKMLRYLPAAHQAAAALDGPVRRRQLSLLHAIADQPMPFYMPVARSVRLFSLNESLLRLKRELRAILTQSWITLDLRSAQVAICAADWGIASVRRFLESGQSIWNALCACLRIEPDQIGRDALKRAVYAVVYGAERATITGIFVSKGFLSQIAMQFLDLPLIQDILAARDQQCARILDHGGAEDAFGRWIAGERRTWRSVLAQLGQARELQLLTPAIDLAQQTTDFIITTWLHDGFTIDVSDSRRADLWVHRLTTAVNRHTAALGITTELQRDEG